MAVTPAEPAASRSGARSAISGEIERPKRPPDHEHRDQHAEIADAVDDERLLARVGVGLLGVPEADQEIGAEAHPFPAHEEHRQARTQHQHQHEDDEQVEIREVTARNPGRPACSPMLNRWIRLPTPVTTSSMTVESWSTWRAHLDVQSSRRASSARARRSGGASGGCPRSCANTATATANAPASTPTPMTDTAVLACGRAKREHAVHQEAEQRQGQREPDPPHRAGGCRVRGRLGAGPDRLGLREEGRKHRGDHQPCSRLMFLRSTDLVWRKMARMIASPTAASAAATVMTKNTMTWPPSPSTCEKRHERQVHRVEHQLDAHEQHDGVAPEQHSGDADA